MLRILIVEDNKDIASSLSDLLERTGYACIQAYTKANAMQLLGNESFDLILLDIALPDGSGYAVCNAIKKTSETPVILLTAMDDETSIVTGFDLGADDYVTKPFKPMELISRVKYALRKSGKIGSTYTIGGLKVDTAKASVRKNDCEVNLSALEYRLLLTFLNHPGEVLSRNRLLGEIWDAAGDFIGDNTLTVYIKRLREKVEDNPSEPTIIITVRGFGYRLGG